MEWNDFIEAVEKVLETGDIQLAKKLERIARENNNPSYLYSLGVMFDPVPQEMIDDAIRKRKDIQYKMMADYVPNQILDNLGNLRTIKDFVSSRHYFRLAFEGMKKLAESGDVAVMSMLSELYLSGTGTPVNKEQSTYWMDQCYLLTTGMTYDKWLKTNT